MSLRLGDMIVVQMLFLKSETQAGDVSSITGLSRAGSDSWSLGTAHKLFAAGKLGTQLKRLGRSSSHVPELSPSSLFLCRLLALSFDLAGASQRAKSKIQTCLCPGHFLTG